MRAKAAAETKQELMARYSAVETMIAHVTTASSYTDMESETDARRRRIMQELRYNMESELDELSIKIARA